MASDEKKIKELADVELENVNGGVAPSLGFLGTVVGMVQAFEENEQKAGATCLEENVAIARPAVKVAKFGIK